MAFGPKRAFFIIIERNYFCLLDCRWLTMARIMSTAPTGHYTFNFQIVFAQQRQEIFGHLNIEKNFLFHFHQINIHLSFLKDSQEIDCIYWVLLSPFSRPSKTLYSTRKKRDFFPTKIGSVFFPQKSFSTHFWKRPGVLVQSGVETTAV